MRESVTPLVAVGFAAGPVRERFALADPVGQSAPAAETVADPHVPVHGGHVPLLTAVNGIAAGMRNTG